MAENGKVSSELNENVCSHTLDHFAEGPEVNTIINSTESIFKDDIALEAAHERLTIILDQYQEQPHLLDRYLEGLVNRLLAITKETCFPAVYHQSFKYLYLISKVRGYKNIVRLFPHEVPDVEYVLTFLNKQDPNDHETWETRYVLLLWLSIVCMIPFDMSRFDGTMKIEGGHRKPVVDRIIDIAQTYLNTTDKSRDAAAIVLAKFVTRPDVKQKKLAGFLDWSLNVLTQSNGDTMKGVSSLMGTLSTLALIFKHGKRDDLIPYAATVLNHVSSCKVSELKNTLLRKLGIKLVQRLGLTFLKPRIAAWRYKRGNRSLVLNLSKTQISNENQDSVKSQKLDNIEDVDDEYDVPEEIEDVLDQLLTGLKDKDTIVRWSAAKGIGRITGRLPKDLADEVVGSVLEFFSLRETDAAWHGGCMALAELGRRGLLLPSRLSEVVPVVLKALMYDEKRGTYSVGAHVRDGGCYVCWAFARAYEPKELKPFVQNIASALVIATVFDREINCRRAASAAFQENVGRQGTFPHGIDIITTADYFAVGNRTNSYLTISLFIAQFKEYTKPLIDHLVNAKLQHWDSAVRELSAKALHLLTAKAPEYMAKSILPQVLSQTMVIDLNTRHGNILAAAELTHALYLHYKESRKSVAEVIDADCVKHLKEIVPKLTDAKLFRGLGGEFMRSAVCHLIEKLSISELPFHDDPIIEFWQNTIDDNIPHLEPDIQELAVKALMALCNQYYVKRVQDDLINKYIEQLHHSVETTRMGFAKALGSLPSFMLSGQLRKVIPGLIETTKLHGKNDGLYAEPRREAIKALANICGSVGLSTANNASEDKVVGRTTLREVYESFLAAMSDYSTDSRGDVGAWVREASMSGLELLTCQVVKTDPSLLPADICEKMMCCLAQQAAEKIDRTRSHAGGIFLRLVYQDSVKVPHIPHHSELLEIFPRSDCSDMNWSAPSECFLYMTKLLGLQTYQYSVLLGMIVSVGGMTESLVRHSSSSLLRYLKEIQNSKEKLEQFGETLLHIYSEHKKNDRVIIPLFKVIDLLLSNGVFDLFLQEEGHAFPASLLSLTSKEITKSGDAKKLLTSINVFCGLIQFDGNTRKKTLSQLLMMLCHRYPRVRNTTADQFYTTLLTYDDLIPEDSQEEVMSILSETSWEADIQTVREQRNKICDLLSLPRPKLKSTAASRPAAATPANQDELSSYKALVSSHDY